MVHADRPKATKSRGGFGNNKPTGLCFSAKATHMAQINEPPDKRDAKGGRVIFTRYFLSNFHSDSLQSNTPTRMGGNWLFGALKISLVKKGPPFFVLDGVSKNSLAI